MKRLGLFAAAIVAIASPAVARQTPATPSVSAGEVTTFLQVGRLLADPSTGAIQRDKTIVIRGNQVVQVRDGFVGDAAQGRVVDLRQAFVLPGLIDSHVHLTGQQNPNARLEEVTLSDADQAMVGARYARRTLMAGFTTVADLGAGNEAIFALRNAVRQIGRAHV